MVGRGWERGREGERVCISNEGMSMEYVAVDKWGGWVERELESAFFWLIFPRVLLSVTHELLERERERERARTHARARERERETLLSYASLSSTSASTSARPSPSPQPPSFRRRHRFNRPYTQLNQIPTHNLSNF